MLTQLKKEATMKKGLRYIAMMLMAIGCSKSELPEYDAPSLNGGAAQDENAINFIAADNWDNNEEETKTKGAVIESSSLDNFGVLAYYLPAKGGVSQTELSDDATPNFMYNQKVERTKSGEDWGNWTYSPVKYWSNNANDRFKFFAYAPHNSEASSSSITLSANTEGDYPTVTLIPADEARNQVDFMTAQTSLLHKDTNNGEVEFNFTHQLTQVLIAVKHNGKSNDHEVVVENVKLRKLNAYAGQFKNNDFIWNQKLPNDLAYTMTLDMSELSEIIPEEKQKTGDTAIDNITFKDIYTEAGVFLVHPQEININDFSISVSFKHRKKPKTEWTEKFVELTVNKAFTFEKNKAVRLNIILDLTGTLVEPYVKLEVAPWQTVINNENIQNYPMLNLRTPGWEDGGDNDLTNPAVPDLELGDWITNTGNLDETLE